MPPRPSSKLGRWVGLKIARRVARTVPVLGAVVSLAVLGEAVRRKGLLLGLLDTGLDALPVVGALKGGVEMITGDLITERHAQPSLDAARLQALRAAGLL
jgi:hypothetical protein